MFGACTVDDIEEQEEDSGVVNKGYGSILEPERQPVPRCVYTVAPPLSLGHTGILVMPRRAHPEPWMVQSPVYSLFHSTHTHLC